MMMNNLRSRILDRAKLFWSQLTVAEISGALGDLGTFLPLVVGLVKVAGLDLGTTLLFTGVYNIITGILFEIPMPVQPMKTIAAVALADNGGLTIPQIMAAGVFVSSCVLFFGASGLMSLAVRVIPAAVIRGMQLGLGLNLAVKGFQQVWYDGGPPDERPWWEVDGRFLGLAAILFTFLTVFPRDKIALHEESGTSPEEDSTPIGREMVGSSGRTSKSSVAYDKGGIEVTDCEADPYASPENSAGMHLTVQEPSRIGQITIEHEPGVLRLTMVESAVNFVGRLLKPIYVVGDAGSRACGSDLEQKSIPSIGKPTPGIPAALVLVVLGLILTIATNTGLLAELSLGPSKPEVVVPSSRDWRVGILRAGLPQLSLTVFNSVISVSQLAIQLFPDKPASPGRIATSVGLMNLVGAWFGAMPSCHGAGGLAAQVRFGARYGTAPIFLGSMKIVLSLFFGSSLFFILQSFPSALLGAMLVIAGMELAAVARYQRSMRGMAVLLFTAAVTLALQHTAEGAVAGLIIAYSLAFRDAIVDFTVQLWRRLKNQHRSEHQQTLC